MLLAFDPGKSSVGWAAFDSGTLARCGFLRGDSRSDLNRQLFERFDGTGKLQAVVEVPQIYQQRKWKGDPNDLVEVALTAGAVAFLFRHTRVKMVRPRDWKGTVPKERRLDDYIVHRRNVAALEGDGAEAYGTGLGGVPKSMCHNVADAVGIGLWSLR